MKNNILQEIVTNKKKELFCIKEELPLDKLKGLVKDTKKSVKNFKDALTQDKINIIAEIKKASPSKGELCSDLDILKYAKLYESAGACAISVLTEKKYFKGDPSYLKEISSNVNIPVLRKDFIIDEYQIYESKLLGADAILLIADILTESEIRKFLDIAKSLELDCITEAHDEQEVLKILNTDAEIIGINNRSLKDFKVDIKTTEKLKQMIPADKIIVSESGIFSYADISYLKNLGVNAFLIGEAIVKSKDPFKKLKELQGLIASSYS